MTRQCLNRRIDSLEILRDEVAAWQASRDRIQAWRSRLMQFTTDAARVGLKRIVGHLMNDDTTGFGSRYGDLETVGIGSCFVATLSAVVRLRRRMNRRWTRPPTHEAALPRRRRTSRG